MPKSYEQIAVWAQGCSIQLRSGSTLAEVLEFSEVLPARQKRKVCEKLNTGKALSSSLLGLYPHLSFADINMIVAASKSGKLAQGFELLAAQYFLRSRVLSSIFTAFIYPVGIVIIGFFLIGVQAVLYQESLIKTELWLFAWRIGLSFGAIYALRKLISFRAPLPILLIRNLPLIRMVSKFLCSQRLVWVLRETTLAGLSVEQSFQLAGDSFGRSRVTKRLQEIQRELALGGEFKSLFGRFTRVLPRSVRASVPVRSPYDLPEWANLIIRNIDDRSSAAIARLSALSKPIAVLLVSPVIFFQIQYLWEVMGRELAERAWVLF